jgi:hypothetical protein
LPNEMLVSKIKTDNLQKITSDDQITKINRSKIELSVSGVNRENLARVGDYSRFYQRSKSVAIYQLKEAFPTLNQNYNFMLEENKPMKVDSDHEYKPMTDVIFVEPNPLLIQKIAEKDAIIKDLTAKLNEFERISSFEFDGLELPADYYENDAYSDR